MKQINLNKNKRLMIILLLVNLLVITSLGSFFFVRIDNQEKIKSAITMEDDTKGSRDLSIITLTKILENREKILNDNEKIELTNHISFLYYKNLNYTRALEYAMRSAYLNDRIGDYFNEAIQIYRISQIFEELGGFVEAEGAIKVSLDLKIEEDRQRDLIRWLGHLCLGSIYSKTDRSDMAIEEISKAMEYEDKEVIDYSKYVLDRKIVEARAYFYKGDMQRCKEILDEIENKPKTLDDQYRAYLSIRAMLSFYEGNINDGITYSDELFKICNENELWDLKKDYMQRILEILINSEFKENKDWIDEYEHYLVNDYSKIIDNKNKSSISFILNNFESEIREYEKRNQDLKIVINLIILLMLMSGIIALLVIISRKARREVNIDGLTRVFNRRKFDYEYRKHIRRKIDTGLIILDIDNFKSINDKYGHDFGDEVLREVAFVLEKRSSKIVSIFRYGGEEFCILCKNSDLEYLVSLAEDIRMDIEDMEWDEDIKVTISLGVASTSNSNNLFKRADENLYKSKENGRNKVTY